MRANNPELAGASAPFRIGIRMPAAGSIPQIVDTVRRAEQAGFEMAWFPDSPLNYRELWSVLGAVAVSTDRIGLGAAVTNLVGRHVSITASAARTVSEAVPGRFMVGIGTGDSAVGYAGLRPSRVAEMEEGIVRIRALMRGDEVNFDGFPVHLRGADQSPPIMLGASGPKTLAMGGRVADGVITPFGGAAEKLRHVARGAAEVGRSAPPVYCSMMTGVVTDFPTTLRSMKVFVARIAQLEGVQQFVDAGFTVEGDFLAHQMGAQGDIGHAADVAELSKQLDQVISDDLALWYMRNRTLLGTEADILAGLARIKAMGIAGVYLVQYENSVLPNEMIEAAKPLLRQWALAK
jgi:5,10-methylenetetrahydromethanopterin reductase